MLAGKTPKPVPAVFPCFRLSNMAHMFSKTAPLSTNNLPLFREVLFFVSDNLLWDFSSFRKCCGINFFLLLSSPIQWLEESRVLSSGYYPFLSLIRRWTGRWGRRIWKIHFYKRFNASESAIKNYFGGCRQYTRAAIVIVFILHFL